MAIHYHDNESVFKSGRPAHSEPSWLVALFAWFTVYVLLFC